MKKSLPRSHPTSKETLEEPEVTFEDAADGVGDQVGEREAFQDPVHTTRPKVRHF